MYIHIGHIYLPGDPVHLPREPASLQWTSACVVLVVFHTSRLWKFLRQVCAGGDLGTRIFVGTVGTSSGHNWWRQCKTASREINHDRGSRKRLHCQSGEHLVVRRFCWQRGKLLDHRGKLQRSKNACKKIPKKFPLTWGKSYQKSYNPTYSNFIVCLFVRHHMLKVTVINIQIYNKSTEM